MKYLNKKAFTLIELLVVVLIIGILVAIAVPQYQVAVGKSRFATIKNMAQTIAEAEEIYYLANSKYTNQYSDLDIVKPNNINCTLWAIVGNQQAVACWINIDGVKTGYYQFFQKAGLWEGKRICLTYSVNTNSTAHKVCQQETGKTAEQAECDSSYCEYFY